MADDTLASCRPRDLAGMLALDPAEIREGFRDGLRGEPEPGGNRSPAYRQGWRAGAQDSRRLGLDAHDRELARVWSAWIGSAEGAAWLERGDEP